MTLKEKKVIMGIENEFTLLDTGGNPLNGSLYFSEILKEVDAPCFTKSTTCARLATGGSFYVDEENPEITTSPFLLKEDGITALAENLFLQQGVILEALHRYNQRTRSGLYLNGYSAHYNFTFPEIAKRNSEVCYLLAQTVNPALQLFLENRHSSGVMYRYREHGRLEICADYIPQKEDVITALAFQVAMLGTIDDWLAKKSYAEIREILGYTLLKTPQETNTREGYILRTPEVINKGRNALLRVEDSKGRTRKVTAQNLLEHYFGLFEEVAQEILQPNEMDLLTAAVEGKIKLPIDSRGYPRGYNKISPQPIQVEKAISPLTRALGNSVQDRESGDVQISTLSMRWDELRFNCKLREKEYTLAIPLAELVAFDRIVDDPVLLVAIVEGKLTTEQRLVLQVMGVKEPEGWVRKRSLAREAESQENISSLLDLIRNSPIYDFHRIIDNFTEIINPLPREKIRKISLEEIILSRMVEYPVKEEKILTFIEIDFDLISRGNNRDYFSKISDREIKYLETLETEKKYSIFTPKGKDDSQNFSIFSE